MSNSSAVLTNCAIVTFSAAALWRSRSSSRSFARIVRRLSLRSGLAGKVTPFLNSLGIKFNTDLLVCLCVDDK